MWEESLNSPEMVWYCMEFVETITEKFNAEQSPVITVDQLVCAQGKRLLWLYLQEFENMKCCIGALHMEMAFSDVITGWLDESGWEQILVSANIASSSRVENYFKGTRIKRKRNT